eukprot:gene40657-54978_t
MSSIRVLSHAFRAWRRNLRSAKHEPETPYLADLLTGAPVCLHVGASDGRHTYVMTQVAPDARIVAFEPSAFTFAVLGHCLAWHGIARQVTRVHAAVSDTPGEIARAGWAGRTPSSPDLDDIGVATQPTPVVTLDGWCAANGVEHVDFIRMDIEGAEQLALTGAAAILDRDKPHVLLEIHPVMLKAQFGGSAEAVIDLFLSRGYRMFALNADSLEERTTAVPDLPRQPCRGARSGRLWPLISVYPPEDPFREEDAEWVKGKFEAIRLTALGSYDWRQAKADFSGPLGSVDGVQYRLTGLYRDSGTQVDFEKNDRAFIAPSASWQIGPDTRLTVLGQYQNDDAGHLQFLPASGVQPGNPNGRIPTRRNDGEPSYNGFD